MELGANFDVEIEWSASLSSVNDSFKTWSPFRYPGADILLLVLECVLD